jgi:hypothetical protein
MSLSKFFKPQVLISLGLILILAVVAFGYAAANIVPESGAGDGTGTVSGYTITNIDYTLLTSDPSKVQLLTLDVAATAGAGDATDVRITVDSGTTWITCTGPAVNTWTCTFGVGSEPSVSAISDLQVVAAE